LNKKYNQKEITIMTKQEQKQSVAFEEDKTLN